MTGSGSRDTERLADAAGLYSDTISDAVRRSAARFRGRTALTFAGRAWSFAALSAAAGRVARFLLDAGFQPGDRIAAFGRNSDAYLILWLACARADLVHVPINYSLRPEELRYILDQSGAAAILHDGGLAGTVQEALTTDVAPRAITIRGAPPNVQDILSVALDANAPELPAGTCAANRLAQLLYTSGTTAAPKGAAMTDQALHTEYRACIIEMEFSSADVALAALPLYHSAQLHCFTMPQLLVGAVTHLIETPAPDIVLEMIEPLGVTSFFAPPTVWIGLLRHPDFERRKLRTLRNVYYGASIMPVPVLDELRRKLPGVRLFNCYGQSEIGPLATILRPEEHEGRPASAGRPVLTVETRIVDEDMRDVPPHSHGEIVHRSPQLLKEYWNKPEETREAFSGGWFHSGDVGYFDEEGYLYVVDRLKDVIKTGGVIVASREVEDALFKHPSVFEAAVVGLADPKWIEAVTAVVVLKPGHEPDEHGLIAHAREHLAPYKVPKRVIFIDSLPRNASGKLLKRDLRASYSRDTAS